MQIKSTSEYRPGSPPYGQHSRLSATPDFVFWIEQLPPNAELFPIQVDIGTQRDPRDVLIGMRAIWEESRG